MIRTWFWNSRAFKFVVLPQNDLTCISSELYIDEYQTAQAKGWNAGGVFLHQNWHTWEFVKASCHTRPVHSWHGSCSWVCTLFGQWCRFENLIMISVHHEAFIFSILLLDVVILDHLMWNLRIIILTGQVHRRLACVHTYTCFWFIFPVFIFSWVICMIKNMLEIIL